MQQTIKKKETQQQYALDLYSPYIAYTCIGNYLSKIILTVICTTYKDAGSGEKPHTKFSIRVDWRQMECEKNVVRDLSQTHTRYQLNMYSNIHLNIIQIFNSIYLELGTYDSHEFKWN